MWMGILAPLVALASAIYRVFNYVILAPRLQSIG